MSIATINPATGETLKHFQSLTGEEIDQKLTQSQTAWISFRQTSFRQRQQWLENAAELLERDAENLQR